MTDEEIQAVATEVADSVAADARASDGPVVFVTGNSYMPPWRSFPAIETVWQADDSGDDYEALVEAVERALEERQVYIDCPEWDNAIYAVDLRRWKYRESEEEAETLSGEWEPV